MPSWYATSTNPTGNSPAPYDTEVPSLQKINALLVIIASKASSLASGITTPFATSISDAQAKSSSSVGVGNIIEILNAVNPGELSGYVLQVGAPTQSSPFQFQPNDNPSLTYSLVF